MLTIKDSRMVMSSDNPRRRHGSGPATRASVAMPAKDRRRSLNRSLARAVGESARSCCSCGSNGDAMGEYPGDVQLFINGSYVDGASEERQQVRSAVLGDVIGSAAVHTRA